MGSSLWTGLLLVVRTSAAGMSIIVGRISARSIRGYHGMVSSVLALSVVCISRGGQYADGQLHVLVAILKL